MQALKQSKQSVRPVTVMLIINHLNQLVSKDSVTKFVKQMSRIFEENLIEVFSNLYGSGHRKVLVCVIQNPRLHCSIILLTKLIWFTFYSPFSSSLVAIKLVLYSYAW